MDSTYPTEDLFENVPQLTPIWHDTLYQQWKKKCFPEETNKLVDVIGAGVDLLYQNGEFICRDTKSPNDEWNFASTSCALPFVPGNRVTNSADPCLEPMKEAKERFIQNCLSIRRLRVCYKTRKNNSFVEHLIPLYNKLKEMESNNKFEKVDVYESVMRLAMNLGKGRPPPVNLSYIGGSVATSYSENKQRILLHPFGKKLNRLGITRLEEVDVPNKHFQAVPFGENSPKLKRGHIIQISSSIDGYCYVRQKESCHFVDFNDLHNIECNRIIHGKELASIASSPYCPSDFIVIHKGGSLEFRNLEESEPLWSLFKHEYELPYAEIGLTHCSFGSHPQSILCLNERYLCSFDMRVEGNQQSIIMSSDYETCSHVEKLISCKGCAVSPFQHVLSSTNNMFVCDERYPKRPVLIYNHMLKGYPLYCDSAVISDAEDFSDVVVVLGTQDCNELSSFAIRAQHFIVQPISLSPPLHLSSPSDCAESLKLHCIPVDDNLVQRLASPLVGVTLVPHSNLGYSVFQLNSLGDLFYQDFVKVASSQEKSHQVSLGCVLTTPDEILPQLSQFMPESCPSFPSEPPDSFPTDVKVDLTDIFNSMKETIAFCKICRPGTSSTIANEVNRSAYICPTCGYSDAESENICDAINNSGLLIGPTKELTISGLFDTSKFKDQYSKRILDVWDKPYYDATHVYDSDTNLSSLTLSSSCPSPASSIASLSMTEDQSNDRRSPMPSTSNDDSMTQLLNISMNSSSLNDFYPPLNDSFYPQSFDEFVPPSQDVRPLVGETLRQPKRLRTSSVRDSFSLKAGF